MNAFILFPLCSLLVCRLLGSIRPHGSALRPLINVICSVSTSGFVNEYTGSWDVFAVRTSKPVENLWENGLFWWRYSFVTHIDRKPRDWGLARSIKSLFLLGTSCLGRPCSVTLRGTFRAPARTWLAVIDFQNDQQQSRTYALPCRCTLAK